MREDRTNLAKYAIVANERSHVPIQSHFSFNIFSIAALNNIDHIDRNSLSGVLSTHDTAMSLFQIKPDIAITKQNKSTVALKDVKSLDSLPCQQIVWYKSFKSFELPISFKVKEEKFEYKEKKSECKNKEL